MHDFQFFDPNQDLSVVYKKAPHWAQSGTMTFITWRTADSLPVVVLNKIRAERDDLIRAGGLDPTADWKRDLAARPAPERGQLQPALFESWDNHLDAGAGECLLARPELSRIVADSLHHFDESRYVLTDFVIMPNHVHLLAAFRDEAEMLSQCTAWKRFTGRQINAAVGRSGAFWQVEQFDHLVRSAEQFERFRRYIAENPRKAGLAEGQFRWYSKNLGR
jgi:type I restriction enzyme R subunit